MVELGKKMFAVKDIEKVKEELMEELKELEIWVKELETRVKELQKQECFEDFFEVCQLYGDCTRCPLKCNCRFAEEGCEEVFLCETCPRLRYCVEKGNPGVYIYLRDSKMNNTGE